LPFTSDVSRSHRFAPTTTSSGSPSGTNDSTITAAGDVVTKVRQRNESADIRCDSLQQWPSTEDQVPVPKQLAAKHQPSAARGWGSVHVSSVHAPSPGTDYQRDGDR
jgi:hypothetical protein